jgi:hypothetical protein
MDPQESIVTPLTMPPIGPEEYKAWLVTQLRRYAAQVCPDATLVFLTFIGPGATVTHKVVAAIREDRP